MAVEKYRFEENIPIGEDRETTIIYVDSFDPDEFKSIVVDSGQKPEVRHRCAIRLLSAKVLTFEELSELIGCGQSKA